MEIFLEELHLLPKFQPIRVITGQQNLKRMIRQIALLDCPDRLSQLSSTDLLVSTGYLLRGEPELQRRIVDECIRREIPAMALSESFLSSQDASALLEAADIGGFPVLSLRDDVSSQEFNRFLTDNYYSRSDFNIKKKSDVILEMNDAMQSNGFPGIIKCLQHWTGLHVWLHSIKGEFSYSYPDVLEQVPELLLEKKHMRSNLLFEYTLNEKENDRLLGGVLMQDGELQGMLCLRNRTYTRFIEDDAELVGIAAGICTNALKYNRDMLSLRYEQVYNLTSHVLSGTYSYQAAASISQGLGYQLPRQCQLAMIQVRTKNSYDLANMVNRHFFMQNILASMLSPGLFLAVLPCASQQAVVGLEQYLKNKKYRIVYDSVTPYEELPRAYHRLTQALKVAEYVLPEQTTVNVEELGVYNLLPLAEEPERLRAYLQRYIQPLLESREESLLQTVQTFVQSFYNYSEAARRLFLHSNTVRYRMGLAQRLCNVDLSDEKQRFEFELALHLYRIHPLILEDGEVSS